VSPGGDIIGLDYDAVISTLRLYGGGQKEFEDILLLWSIERK